MANTESSEKAGRIIVRLFFIVLACVLLLMGYDHYKPLVVGNDRPLTDGGCAGLLYFRDRRIDRLEPTVTQGSADPDAAAQARAAADACLRGVVAASSAVSAPAASCSGAAAGASGFWVSSDIVVFTSAFSPRQPFWRGR